MRSAASVAETITARKYLLIRAQNIDPNPASSKGAPIAIMQRTETIPERFA